MLPVVSVPHNMLPVVSVPHNMLPVVSVPHNMLPVVSVPHNMLPVVSVPHNMLPVVSVPHSILPVAVQFSQFLKTCCLLFQSVPHNMLPACCSALHTCNRHCGSCPEYMTAARKWKLCTGCTTNSSIPLVHVQAQIQDVPVLDRLIKEESCIRDDSDAIRDQGYGCCHRKLLYMDSPEFRHFISKLGCL